MADLHIFAQYRDQIAALKEQLRARNEQFDLITAREAHFPASWQLAGNERRILGALARKGAASSEALMTAMYYDVREADWPEYPESVLSVTMCRLRRKMSARGIEIFTLPGAGYALESTAAWRLRQILNGNDDPLASSHGKPGQKRTRQSAITPDQPGLFCFEDDLCPEEMQTERKKMMG